MTRLNIVKVAIIPKLIYRFNDICIKMPPDFAHPPGVNKLIIKFMEMKEIENSHINLETQEQHWKTLLLF